MQRKLELPQYEPSVSGAVAPCLQKLPFVQAVHDEEEVPPAVEVFPKLHGVSNANSRPSSQ